jgi:hypothetical protein
MSSTLVILPPVHNCLPHPVDILGTLPLALLQVDVTDHLLPPRRLVQLGPLLLDLGLLADVLGSPFLLFLFLFLPELLELLTSLFLSLLLVFPFAILPSLMLTLLSLSIFCNFSYYYRILRVT